MNTYLTRDEKPYFVSNKTVYYLLGIVQSLLLLRFMFKLLGANSAAGIVRLIYNITDVLMAPFAFIFPTVAAGQVRLEWSVLVAMALYALIVYGLMGLIDIFRTADTNRT